MEGNMGEKASKYKYSFVGQSHDGISCAGLRDYPAMVYIKEDGTLLTDDMYCLVWDFLDGTGIGYVLTLDEGTKEHDGSYKFINKNGELSRGFKNIWNITKENGATVEDGEGNYKIIPIKEVQAMFGKTASKDRNL